MPPTVLPGAHPARRAWLMAGAGIALLAGLDGALLLLGVWAPLDLARLATWHGPLMVLGFVGTLIALERAIAWGRALGHLVPLLGGLGALALASPAPPRLGLALLTAAQVGLVGLYLPLWSRSRDDAALVQTAGAVCSAGAAGLLLARTPVPQVLPWLVGFLVLTIVGERMELSRLTMAGDHTLALLCLALLTGLVLALARPQVGWRACGAVLVVMALWLWRHDVARIGLRTVRARPAPRAPGATDTAGQGAYVGALLMLGYLWLAVAGAVWLAAGPTESGPAHDAGTHAALLGFTMGMVMGHVPVIAPAVLRARLEWTPWFWLPAVLLEGSLVVRLGIGDALARPGAVRLGGVVNVVSLLTLVLVVITHVHPRRTGA